MTKYLKFIGIFVCAIIVTGCVTATGEKGIVNINAIEPKETYVFFSQPKDKGTRLPISMCNHRENQTYRFPSNNKFYPGCIYGTGPAALNAVLPSEAFTLALLGRPGALWFKASAVDSGAEKFGNFHFVKVPAFTEKDTKFFPAFLLAGNRLGKFQGRMPVFNIKKNKVTYLGRWTGNVKAPFDHDLTGIHEALAQSGINLPSGALNLDQPEFADIECGKRNNLFTGKPSRSKSASASKCSAGPLVSGSSDVSGGT